MSSEPVNPLFDLANDSTVPEKPVEKSANPLYDLENTTPNGDQNGHEEDSLMNGGASNGDVTDHQETTENLVSEDSGVTMDTQAAADAGETTLDEDVEPMKQDEEEEEEEEQIQEEEQEEEVVEDQTETAAITEDGSQPDVVAEQDQTDDTKDQQTFEETAEQEGAAEPTDQTEITQTQPEASDAAIDQYEEAEQSAELETEPEQAVKQEVEQAQAGASDAPEESPAAEEPAEEEVVVEEEVQEELAESQEQAPTAEEDETAQESVSEAAQAGSDETPAVSTEPEQVDEVVKEAEEPVEVLKEEQPPVEEPQPQEVAEPVVEHEDAPEAKPEHEEVTETETESVAQADEAPQGEDSEATEPVETPVTEADAEIPQEAPVTQDLPLEGELVDGRDFVGAEETAEPPSAPEEQEVGVGVEPAAPLEVTSREPLQPQEQQQQGQPLEEPQQASQAQTEAPEPTATVTETSTAVNGTSEPQNGVEDEVERDPNIVRDSGEKEEVPHFGQLSSVRQSFESRGPAEGQKKQFSIKDEYAEGGEYESTPVVDPEVVRESDRNIGEELPEVGMAKNILSRFKQIEEESAKPRTGRKASPPKQTGPVEYESQPTPRMEQYQGQSESGEFESQPLQHEGVIRSGDKVAEEPLPEKGYTRNLAQKYKEYEAEAAKVKTAGKREITPDRSGKVEFVSEPRGQVEAYAGQSESGVFESQPREEEEDVVKSGEAAPEILPEVGMAKNLLSKFKQMETEVVNYPPPSPKRETPRKTSRPETEQRGYLEKYEPQTESGTFESQPTQRPEVIRSEDQPEEILPEAGTAKKTLDRFKEIQRQSTSPVSRSRKEFTPPREASPGRTVAGVLENQPKEREEGVVKSTDLYEAELPEKGMAKNIVNRFKQIEVERGATSPVRGKKEFTPPPEAGVYENTPAQRMVIEQQKCESGLLESHPTPRRDDVAREDQMSPEQELPERGYAKNLVSKFRQIESESAKQASSASPKFKEFTPPRDTRGLLSPKSPVAGFDGVSPSDLPPQYQEQTAAGVFENQPESRADVAREADTDYNEGMPAANTTMSMLEKFREIQKKAQDDQETPKPISRKESPVKKKKDKGMFIAVETEKCAACQKTVYAMEKLEMNKLVYHRACFKCSHCSARLTPKNFSMNEGVIYCTNHFKQLFARKGNYDEGFGRQQYKKKWTGDAKKDDSS